MKRTFVLAAGLILIASSAWVKAATWIAAGIGPTAATIGIGVTG